MQKNRAKKNERKFSDWITSSYPNFAWPKYEKQWWNLENYYTNCVNVGFQFVFVTSQNAPYLLIPSISLFISQNSISPCLCPGYMIWLFSVLYNWATGIQCFITLNTCTCTNQLAENRMYMYIMYVYTCSYLFFVAVFSTIVPYCMFNRASCLTCQK